jgi:transposase
VRKSKQEVLFIMPGKKGMKHYPKELKLEAVRLFFEEGMTRAEITEALGLRSAGRVKIWVRQYRREGIAAFNKPMGRPRKVEESEKAELERLRMENTLLKKHHSELRKEMLAKRNIGLSIDTEKNTK